MPTSLDNPRPDIQVKKIFFFALFLSITGIIFYMLRTVFTPFLISFCFAYLLDPAVDRLEKWRMQRTTGICLLIVGAFFCLLLSALFLFPLIKVQTEEVVEHIPRYITIVRSWVTPVIGTLARDYAQGIDTVIEKGLNNLGDISLSLLRSTSSYVWGTISSVAGFMVACLSLLIIPVTTFYMLRDIDTLKDQSVSLLPSQYKEKILTIGEEIHGVLKNFVRGQLMVAFLLSVLYSVGLYFCGTPMWIVIGLIAGIANLVPFLGLIVGMFPAVIITFLHYHDLQHTLGTIIVFAVVQVLEGTVITPKIIGDTLGLHPLSIIFAVFAGSELFGFFGLLLAVPVAAVVAIVLKRVLSAYKRFYVTD